MVALDERDRALVTRLVMGCVAATGELDRVIDAHLSRGAKLEPRVRDALRLATYELLYLDTPDSVCVSQGVELVRSVAPRAAGLANAVLRRVAERDVHDLLRARTLMDAGEFGATELARVGALPEWLCERALGSLGPDAASGWARAALGPSVSSVAANRARLSCEEARSLLSDAGCAPEEGPVPGSFLLGRPALLAPSGLVERVDVLPCDLSAQEVALACAPLPGSRVLEVGQGRGTKTVLLEGAAQVAGGLARVVAVEVDAAKSALSSRRMEAAGLADHVTCVAADARTLGNDGLPSVLDGTFDLVFVDAPCSGTGTLARHPEIAWSLGEADVHELSALQLQILEASSARVGEGGVLAYATCSILVEENERVVERFLASSRGEGFELIDELRPDASDLHFVARLRRRRST